MECWKENCKNDVEFLCRCIDPPIYTCDPHIGSHYKIATEKEHRLESLTIIPNPKTKKLLIDHLNKSLSNAYEFRRKTIFEYSMQIKLLNEKIKDSLNGFEEIIQRHRKIISEITSLEIISKINDNKINEILASKPEESIKKLEDIFECFDELKFFIDDKGKIVKRKAKNESNQIAYLFRNLRKSFCIQNLYKNRKFGIFYNC